uniref:rRNA methyltransferase n=1 Tax=Globodera pallida TaxID=36090 RepID=A0A183CG73_GLOPA
MGKKAKVGKQRKDKFYFLAKEAGFRSRAAFKLLQLNKRFEFLQHCRALVDLCAAPGGWLQVAEQQMPVSSLRIGVDLVPIKAIKNCITLQGDIIEEKTRHAVRKELGTWEADCVLHDGAPNLGTNWAHDAFQQNCLTLSALRLATQVLRKGGFFVTKPTRNVWVDPDLLDSKKVFSIQSSGTDENAKINLHRLLLHPNSKERKAKALGYDDDAQLGLHQELGATEFLASKSALQLLSRASELVLDSERVLNSEHTTAEIRECVCGPAELRSILKWRKKLVEEQKKEEKASKENEQQQGKEAMVGGDVAAAEEEEESAELKELEEIDELIRTAKTDEKAMLKKRKKKLLKEKRKLEERKKLKMVHEGDEPTLGEDLELFSLRTVRRLAERAAKAAKGIKEEETEDDSEDEEQEDEEKDDAKDKTKTTTTGTKMEEFDDGLNEATEEYDDDDEEEENENKMSSKGAKGQKLTPEQLAMGEEIIYSKKRARDLEDWAWNRYTSNDDALPDWFVGDEKRHCHLEPPVDKERVDFYAQRDRNALNTRPIKKVAEAKARKRQRRLRRMEKARKKAEGIVDNEQMEHGEKVRELRRLYKKAGTKEKREVKYQVVTKGKKGSMNRPDGHYRLVDKRMKKDTRRQPKRGKKADSKHRTKNTTTNNAKTNGVGRSGKEKKSQAGPTQKRGKSGRSGVGRNRKR